MKNFTISIISSISSNWPIDLNLLKKKISKCNEKPLSRIGEKVSKSDIFRSCRSLGSCDRKSRSRKSCLNVEKNFEKYFLSQLYHIYTHTSNFEAIYNWWFFVFHLAVSAFFVLFNIRTKLKISQYHPHIVSRTSVNSQPTCYEKWILLRHIKNFFSIFMKKKPSNRKLEKIHFLII